MNKKGVSLSINTLVIIALAILVLFVLSFFLSTTIRDNVKKYLTLSEAAEKDINATNICEKMFTDRRCMANCGKYQDLGTDWKDCKNMPDKPRCCKTTEYI